MILKMGATDNKEYNMPVLLCFFEPGNEEQKQYCIKLKDNFSNEEAIRFEIKIQPGAKFSISFKLYGKIYLISDRLFILNNEVYEIVSNSRYWAYSYFKKNSIK